jgi:S-DNA-T family DNA segregation ATPase FtsK/SpoIIIE
VEIDRCGLQIPDQVGEQLMMAAALFAHAGDAPSHEQRSRTLLYGFPGPTCRDVEWVGHHTLHEVVHHAHDIDRIVHPS